MDEYNERIMLWLGEIMKLAAWKKVMPKKLFNFLFFMGGGALAKPH
jgi:hypothetical protein